MREERKLNKAIKKDGINNQSDILEELKRRYPQYVEQSDNKQTPVRKRRVAVFSALAAAAVCAAIIVPCAVLLTNSRNSNNNVGNENIRYCTQSEYTMYDVEYTIGEYRQNNNRNFLYFEWYDFGEDCNTVCYTSNADNEVLCLKERMYLPQYDEMVQLSITKANVYLSAFDSTISNCNSEQFVENHAVKWGIKGEDSFCIFEDGGYRYFIQINPGSDKESLFNKVKMLLGKK